MNFEFATATRIVFGPGSIEQLETIARPLGSRPFLVTGRDVSRAPKAAALLAATTFQVAGEPTFDLVRAAAERARSAGCDCVIAVGGGSVIDAGKAVAMLLTNGGDPLDYAEVIGAGRAIAKPSAPFVAVPTTAGTGSEVTRNAVLGAKDRGVKVSLRSPFMLPAVALVDPALTLDLPPAITAATGMDALSQVIEPFVSVRANPMTDALCREGILRIARSIRRAFHDGRDLTARTDMSLGALFSGIALANAGLGAVHGFAAPIGGEFEAPHGAVCAALLAPVMEMNFAALRERGQSTRRYEDLSVLLTHCTDATVADGVTWLKELARELNIPGLADYGITDAALPPLCKKAAKASSMKGNPVALTDAEMQAILCAAL